MGFSMAECSFQAFVCGGLPARQRWQPFHIEVLTMADKPPTPPAKPPLVWPPNCREVPGVPFAIIGAEHLRVNFKAPAPSPTPSPAPPEK
jgi:hypothetical protein